MGVISAGTSGGQHVRQAMVQTLTWQGAYVVAELGISAPRTKSDEAGRFTDVPTVTAISAFTKLLLDAPAMRGSDLAALAGRVVHSFGIDASHITPPV